MHAQDSVTCRGCHDGATIQPKSESGRASHALLRQGTATCIDCHSNIHGRVPAGSASTAGSSSGGQTK